MTALRAQVKSGGKVFERSDCAAFAACVKCFDHHHGVGIHRLEHVANRRDLLGAGDVAAA
tara:strand:- start:261 stop:440 length:180 start_codon:yes stop_codon:yes gene_type:complete